MDGNGRWAAGKNLPRVMGHRQGAETVRMVIRTCAEVGVRYLTLYAFSRENWKRPKIEIDFLMNLLEKFLDSELKTLKKEGVRFRTIGKVEDLPEKVVRKIEVMKKETEANTRLDLMVALNYGSRQEILEVVNRLRTDAAQAALEDRPVEPVDEQVFSSMMDTSGIPDPDLLIRTSGEMRISNFLLWQLSYSEIYVSAKYWPDFAKDDFLEAIRDFGERHRRFGDVS